MTEPSKNQPQKERDESGCLAPILFWGGLFATFFAARWLESESPGSGKWLFPGIPAAGVVGVIIYIIVGRSVKETMTNIFTIVKWIVGIIVLSFIFGPLLQKCDSDHSVPPSEMYYRR